jgi:hypothetical protein
MSANKLPVADAAAFCAKQRVVCSGNRLRQAVFGRGNCPRPAGQLFGPAPEGGKDPLRWKISMPMPFRPP